MSAKRTSSKENPMILDRVKSVTPSSRDTVQVTCGCGKVIITKGSVYNRNCRDNGEYKCLPCILSSPEYKAKQLIGLSKAPKKVWTEEERLAQSEKFKSPEIAAKLSAASKRMWSDPEKKAAMVAKIKKRTNDQEFMAGIKESRSTPEFRAKMSEALTEAMNRPDAKAKHSAAMKRPEVAEKLRVATLKRWEDPEYRAKMVARSKEVWATDERRSQHAHAMANTPKISSIQVALYKMLDDMGVKYVIEHPVGFYLFDCMVPLPDGKKIVDRMSRRVLAWR